MWEVVIVICITLLVPVASQETCPALGCCQEDCCGEGTSWDAESAYCIFAPGSPGFNGTYTTEQPEGCQEHLCCEDTCCASGTYYDLTAKCCLPSGCPCDHGFLCQTPQDKCENEEEGTCEKVPESCEDEEVDYVCGCDDKQYGNECLAHKAGVAVQQPSACFCGRNIALPCHPDYFCNWPSDSRLSRRCGRCEDEACQFEDPPQARCERKPTACPKNFEPVCGCDSVTYSNACFAAAAGTSIEHNGPCNQECSLESPECILNNGYCKFATGDCGLNAGTCAESPTFFDCVLLAPDPVCGCDGNVYTNPCEAAENKVSIQSVNQNPGDPCHEFCTADSQPCSDKNN